MFNLLTALFFSIGLVASVAWIITVAFNTTEKVRKAREHKQAHDKRLLTLLESIDQKLNTKQ